MVARHPGVLSAPPTLIQSKARDMLRKLKLPKASPCACRFPHACLQVLGFHDTSSLLGPHLQRRALSTSTIMC